LNQLPETIGKLKEEMSSKICQTRALYQYIKLIPGTTEEDNWLINEIDQIRLRAMNMIQQTLGSL